MHIIHIHSCIYMCSYIYICIYMYIYLYYNVFNFFGCCSNWLSNYRCVVRFWGCPVQGTSWTWMIFEGPFQLRMFCNSMIPWDTSEVKISSAERAWRCIPCFPCIPSPFHSEPFILWAFKSSKEGLELFPEEMVGLTCRQLQLLGALWDPEKLVPCLYLKSKPATQTKHPWVFSMRGGGHSFLTCKGSFRDEVAR